MQSMELKKLLSYTRQAVDDYKLIKEGDHIAVGISGGKDSLTLLYALAGLAFIRRNSHSRQSPSIWDMTLLILLP